MATTSLPNLTRRNLLVGLAGAAAGFSARPTAHAEIGFEQWIAAFRSKAVARGISEETYTQVMRGVQPDMTGVNAIRNQPEFNQQLWQYLNRAASDWRIEAGKVKAKEYASLLSRPSMKEFSTPKSRSIRLGESNPHSAVLSSRRTICGRSFRRWRRSPGPSRAAAAIGKAN